MSFIPLSEPDLGSLEAEAVQRVTADGWVSTAGPEIPRFEAAISGLLNNTFCVALQSGTAALHLALHMLPGIRNSVVLIPDLTFVGTVNAVLMAGAEPVMLDIDPDTWCMNPENLVTYLQNHTRLEDGVRVTLQGQRISAVIYVPVHGNPGPVAKIQSICRAHNLLLIEDAAAALGSETDQGPCGTLGDLSTLSFNGNKILTTGGGGMICSRELPWMNKARHLAHQGKISGKEYDHDEPAFNYGMTNLSAALGLAQASRFPKILARKKMIHSVYRSAFAGRAVFQKILEGTQTNGWMNTILVNNRQVVLEGLDAAGIGCRPLWKPLHLLPFLSRYGYHTTGDKSISYAIYQQAVSIPSGSMLTDEQLDRVISTLQKLLYI